MVDGVYEREGSFYEVEDCRPLAAEDEYFIQVLLKDAMGDCDEVSLPKKLEAQLRKSCARYGC